jgi:hypothetical protein
MEVGFVRFRLAVDRPWAPVVIAAYAFGGARGGVSRAGGAGGDMDHGGSVMSGGITVHTIFWAPGGHCRWR